VVLRYIWAHTTAQILIGVNKGKNTSTSVMDGASTGAETTCTSGSSTPSKGWLKNRARCETLSTTDGMASIYDSQHAVVVVATAAATTTTTQPEDVEDVPRWFPRCCGKPILHGKPEAMGFLFGMM
jgi:hypothetical protein